MSGYFDRGASAGGHDHGLFDRKDVTGPEGVGTGVTGGPGAVANENLDADQYEATPEGTGSGLEQGSSGQSGQSSAADNSSHGPYESVGGNPNVVSATGGEVRLDETAGVSSPARADENYGRIIEGSDSERTGTSWGLSGTEQGAAVESGQANLPEGEQSGDAHPNRNTASSLERDQLNNVGSWSTIDSQDSAGSPTGNS